MAKIHADNTRSIQAFVRCGFALDHATSSTQIYLMTAARCLQRLRDGLLGDAADIQITEFDPLRLRNLLLQEPDSEVADLGHELERATVVMPQQVARDVITMNTQAVAQLDHDKLQLDLVYPEDADLGVGKHTVLSELGPAILDCKEGDELDWRMAQRTCRIAIEKVLFQLEAAGNFERQGRPSPHGDIPRKKGSHAIHTSLGSFFCAVGCRGWFGTRFLAMAAMVPWLRP